MIYQSPSVKVDLLENQLAVLTFDANESVNKLNKQALTNLDCALDILLKNNKIKGLIINSNKDTFIVGADITEFLDLFSQENKVLTQWLSWANQIFNKLEDLPFPTLSAINGFALGGGCETMLATDFRLAEHGARIGLPETQLGIIPGFGGTVRLPRLIGADNAVEWIASGKHYQAKQAMEFGVVDAVVDEKHLLSSAISMLEDASSGQLDWQTRRLQKQSKLALSKTEAAMSFATAKAMVYKQAGKHYPAPLVAVNVIEKAAKHTRDNALAIEQEAFIKLAKSNEAKALIGLFLNDQFIKSKAKKAIKVAKKIDQAAVLGAGIMGGGIAYQNAIKKIPVVLKDIQQSALDLGLDEASKLLTNQLQRGRLSAKQLTETLNRITTSLDYLAIAQANIVIEAVVENPAIKGQVLKELETQVSNDTFITSNTSTISIDSLAQNLTHPERFCGMHFFNPVHKMPLVEVIRGEKTSEETIASVVSYACDIGKTPIVVNDCPGFFVNRVLFPYFAGFNQLLADGADFTFVDKVMEKDFGWPMGPAYLLDVVGIDTAFHAQTVMAQGFPDRMSLPEKNIIKTFYELQRYGQKNNLGFYQYQLDKKGKPKKINDPSVQNILNQVLGTVSEHDKQTVIDYCMIPMIIETVRCLEEKIIDSPAAADLGLIYGLGFPPFKGGVFRYLDTLGLANFIKQADKYAHLGKLYQVTDTMRQMAKMKQSYYSLENA